MKDKRNQNKDIVTDSQYFQDFKEHLECSMLSLRQEMLRVLIKEFMVILRKQDYLFDDLLDSLSLYSEGRADWEEVTQLLNRAADVVRDRRRELTGK